MTGSIFWVLVTLNYIICDFPFPLLMPIRLSFDHYSMTMISVLRCYRLKNLISRSSAYALTPRPMNSVYTAGIISGELSSHCLLVYSIRVRRSLIYTRNRKGERMPPYGTPLLTCTVVWLYLTLHCLRYHCTACFHWGVHPGK